MSRPLRAALAASALALAALSAPSGARAIGAERYFSLKVSELPGATDLALQAGYWYAGLSRLHQWTARLDGPGEAYVLQGGWPDRDRFNELLLVAAVPEGSPLTGHVMGPRSNGEPGRATVRFELGESASGARAEDDFHLGKEQLYRELSLAEVPGGFLFRSMADEELAKVSASGRPQRPTGRGFGPPREGELERTLELFTGGRAISENLQLDRLIPPATADGEEVSLAKVKGITVKEFDWATLVGDEKPAADPLAALVPHDQYAVLFPSFTAMTSVLDELDARGTPLLRLYEPRAEDARTRERYERQLCLSLSAISRLLGPTVIGSVAMTGSDLYLKTGSDVAVLLEAREMLSVRAFITAKQQAALADPSSPKAVEGEVAGVAYKGVVSPSRAICCYSATLGDVMVVTNSLTQLERIVKASKRVEKPLSELGEYAFFRKRYARGEEDEGAFVLLPDAAIRKWCGPRWRIASSRRTQAAAVLSELLAGRIDEVVGGQVERRPLATSRFVPELGKLAMEAWGPESGTYGNLAFLTPIAELPLDTALRAETRMYDRWREGYERNWSNFFDPIAARLTVKDHSLALDLTVMPLILGTDYREIIEVARGVQIAPDAGDPHDDALVHAAVAINADSKPVEEVSGFILNMVPGLKTNPLSWLGTSIALYVDDSEIWQTLALEERALFRSLSKIPVALVVAVRNPVKAALFLAALRAFAQQTAPGMTEWRTRIYKDVQYVEVGPAANSGIEEEARDVRIYYATIPGAIVLTPNEPTLQRAIDRMAAGKAAAPDNGEDEADEAKPGGDGAPAATASTPPAPATEPSPQARQPVASSSPWIGDHLGLRVTQKGAYVFQNLFRSHLEPLLRDLSWSNLFILNEWRRRFPDRDPVETHLKVTGTRLVCPGGGVYRWNEAARTMESSVFGHPDQETPPEVAPLSIFSDLRRALFGLTFEENGLRIRAKLDS